MVYTKEYAALGGKQSQWAARAGALIRERLGPRPLAYTRTFGCQQNVSDGERLDGVLAALGFGRAASPDDADLVLLNTCAVRENAENRVLGNIGALKAVKEARPGMILGVCGCMAQRPEMAEKIRRSYPYVDLVFGSGAAHRLPALLARLLGAGGRVIDCAPPGGEIAEGVPILRQQGARAWLPVMQGCDNFCTYCIVPYVRGREHSRRMEDILAEARALIADGRREITLLGQNVNSYGKGLGGGENFPDLLRAVAGLEGDFVVRFMTSHPKDCTPALIDAVAACGKVCNHIHLPVQSGSDRILALMNRRYTVARYLELLALARERIPGVSFTSDVMVGFPGETEADFRETIDLVRRARFTSLYTFLYSPRVGTRAAEMDDPVPHEEKQRRFEELLRVQEEISLDCYRAQVGRTLRVLAEGEGREPGTLAGHTESGINVQFTGGSGLIGQFADVRIDRALNWAVSGAAVGRPSAESVRV